LKDLKGFKNDKRATKILKESLETQLLNDCQEDAGNINILIARCQRALNFWP